MSKKKRKHKSKEKIVKTKEERVLEIIKIKKQLQELGLSEEFEGIALFYTHCVKYVNDNIPWSGNIKLVGLKRILEAILTTRKTINCSISLKYDQTV